MRSNSAEKAPASVSRAFYRSNSRVSEVVRKKVGYDVRPLCWINKQSKRK
jgi:hypothetical protein